MEQNICLKYVPYTFRKRSIQSYVAKHHFLLALTDVI